MESARKAMVIHSPHSGRSSRLSKALEHLHDAGVEIVGTHSIAELDGLPAQGAFWRDSGIELVIAAGGDGLIGGVITHIAECGLPLGILPLGTANDLARSLRIPQQLEGAASTIAQFQLRAIDIAVAQPSEQMPHLASKGELAPVRMHISSEKHGYFAHALTIGLNVQFARIATNVATRKRFGRLTYPVAALETLKYHDALDVTLHFEGLALPSTTALDSDEQNEHGENPPDELLSLQCSAWQVTVINAPIFGGQWQLRVPDASIDDRLLDIVVIEEVDLGKLNTLLTNVFQLQEQAQEALSNGLSARSVPRAAELSGIPGIHHFQARGVYIRTSADPRDATLDGEVRGQTPMYVHMAEQPLWVATPDL